PICPQEALSFRLSIKLADCIKDSFDITQPADTPGKKPYLSSAGKFVEPSYRIEIDQIFFIKIITYTAKKVSACKSCFGAIRLHIICATCKNLVYCITCEISAISLKKI